MQVYIAAPLFNEEERERNLRLRELVRELGFEAYLPQEDGGVAFNLIKDWADVASTRAKIFKSDVEAIKKCSLLLAVLDGRVPDEGMCVELGIAYALGKPCIGYLTDQRSLDSYGPNLVIEGCLTHTAHSTDELKKLLKTFL